MYIYIYIYTAFIRRTSWRLLWNFQSSGFSEFGVELGRVEHSRCSRSQRARVVAVHQHVTVTLYFLVVPASVLPCGVSRVGNLFCLSHCGCKGAVDAGDHSQWDTIGRTPLHEWSARRRGLGFHNKQTNTHVPAGLEPVILAVEWPQTSLPSRAVC